MIMQENVVLLHGVFRTRRSMAGLARYLRKQGYAVCNISYPSTRHSIEALIDLINPAINEFVQKNPGKTHFVGYSMGGLLIRAYLHRYPMADMGRVVMLGTPNQGSEVADLVKNWRLYKWLYGPAGQQLITKNPTLSDLFGNVHYELGILAGNRSIDPISSWIIGQPSDGKVSIESTKLQGMKEHHILPASHTFFPQNKAAWRKTVAFLKKGTFSDKA